MIVLFYGLGLVLVNFVFASPHNKFKEQGSGYRSERKMPGSIKRCSAYRHRQNHYAKSPSGLQRAISMLRLHNWVRPHSAFDKSMTPAMNMGFVGRAVTMMEVLISRGFQDFTNEWTSARWRPLVVRWERCPCWSPIKLRKVSTVASLPLGEQYE